MKKILSIGVLTLAALWLTPGTSSAGCTFGLFTQASCWPFNYLAGCGCCGCCTKICVKPYNAFSPTCSGTLYCDGMCPLGNGRQQSVLPGYPMESLPSVGSCCDGDGTSLTPPVIPGAMEQAPVSPTPVPSGKASFVMPNYGPMQIGYSYPTFVPAYNYNTRPMAVPYYWNSNR